MANRPKRPTPLASMIEGLVPPVLNAEERRIYRAGQDELILDRFRRGVPFGAAACLVLAAIGSAGQPDAPRWVIQAGGLVAALTAFASVPVSRLAWVCARPNVLLFFASLVVAAAGGLIAAWTGGFESVATVTITLLWVFGSIVTPLSPVQALVDGSGQLAVASIVIATVSPHPGSPVMFAALNTFGIAFLLVGLSLRERASVRAFLVQRSLDEANRALGVLNAELEHRVEEQVAEIKKRAHDVEVLNAQLQQRVIERSRELATALARLARPGRLQSPPVGTVLNGRVELVRSIDSGGMGDVFEAIDHVTQTRVAVKTIHGRRISDISSLQRFVTEARAASGIAHEGIVRTLDVDVTSDGTLFHVMELLEGETLGAWLDRTPRRPVGIIARVGRVIAQALAAAHAAGVIHRDIKPANIMLVSASPGAKLLDFGVSKLIEPARSGGRPREDAGATHAHMLLGTPAYMAPEQGRDPALSTFASDVYSLGVVLYEALAGKLPHEASSAAEYIALHANVPARELGELRHELPAALAGAIMACLEREPAKRPTAAALAEQLAPFEQESLEVASELRPVDEAHASTVATGPGVDANAEPRSRV
jgi:tRNA A-37 threonylcarbamoyl transferase component Bud32